MRARTCSTVERSIRVVWPRRRRSVTNEIRQWTNGCLSLEKALTLTTVDVVQIGCCVSIGTVACLTVKSRLARTASSWVLDDNCFIQVLVEFQIIFTLFHKFCWLWEIFLFSSPRFLA